MISCGNRYTALVYVLRLYKQVLHRAPVTPISVYEAAGN